MSSPEESRIPENSITIRLPRNGENRLVRIPVAERGESFSGVNETHRALNGNIMPTREVTPPSNTEENIIPDALQDFSPRLTTERDYDD